jgi:hypothetical protein
MRSGAKKRTKIEQVIDDPLSVSFEEFLDVWNHAQKLTTPDLHKRFARWLVETMGSPRRHLQAFRFSGKSFITSCYVAWRLFRNPNATFIIISATQKLATRIGTAGEVLGLLQAYREEALGIKDYNLGAKTLNLVSNNAPIVNLWYLKGAYETLILHGFQESVNPGYMARQERKMERDWGQSYILPPSVW